MNQVLRLCLFMFVAVVMIAGVTACKRSFTRPVEMYNLGKVSQLLKPVQHIRDKMMLVRFDSEKGWGAMSTRCTYDGCDLSFRDKVLFNACSQTYYDHYGKVVHGPATRNLPWYEISLSDGNLYANSGKRVSPDYRFMNEELRKLVPKLLAQNQKEGIGGMPKIPKVLQGKNLGSSRYLFTEKEVIDDF